MQAASDCRARATAKQPEDTDLDRSDRLCWGWAEICCHPPVGAIRGTGLVGINSATPGLGRETGTSGINVATWGGGQGRAGGSNIYS